MDSVALLMSLGGAVIAIAVIIAIAFYVLMGISIMKMLTIMGYDKPWMAWIPFANTFAIA